MWGVRWERGGSGRGRGGSGRGRGGRGRECTIFLIGLRGNGFVHCHSSSSERCANQHELRSINTIPARAVLSHDSTPNNQKQSVLMMKLHSAAIIFSLIAIIPSAFCFYEYGTDVMSLTPDNFQQVHDSDHVWLVEFYAPWCGHCKNLVPVWEKVATNLKGIVKIAAIDADKHRSIAGQFGIQGFPTIKMFGADKRKTASGTFYKSPTDYNGGRDARSIVSYATSQLPNWVHQINSLEKLDKFMTSKPKDLARVLLFTDKARTPTLLKAMTTEFRGRLVFGEVRKSDKGASDVVEKFKIGKFPTVLVVKPQGEGADPEIVEYQDKIKVLSLKMFLAGHAASKAQEGEATTSGGSSSKSKSNSNTKSKSLPPAAITLTKENFDREVTNRNEMIMVEFMAPWCGHCKRLAPEWTKAANGLRGIIRFGVVDCDANPELAQRFGVKGYPTIKLFKHGKENKGNPVDYQGARQAAAISQYAISNMPNFVQEVSSTNIQAVFSNSKLNKVVLFTNSPGKPMFKSLAAEFEGRLLLCEASGKDEGLMQQFKVTSVPAIYIAVAQDEDQDKPFEERQITFAPYTGALKRAAIASFLNQIAPKSDDDNDDNIGSSSDDSDEIVQLKNQADFESKCVKKTGLCVVLALSTLDQSQEERDRTLEQLQTVKSKLRGKPFIFTWIDGSQQFEFLEGFGYSSGFPGVIAMNPRKKAYVTFVGRFDAESIEEWLGGVLRGRVRTSRIANVPKLAEPTTHDKKEL
eukprot:TRINITY_DN1783_c0_g1_i3.p1 TRINITY_DN1783_c0_g1~~TRINITY_DN1783_c0_g1_i3.p1  ORF type:complete len:749 (+),score=264.27 TRINITY_DN1783_c0_g1_i3:113-2359(+)